MRHPPKNVGRIGWFELPPGRSATSRLRPGTRHFGCADYQEPGLRRNRSVKPGRVQAPQFEATVERYRRRSRQGCPPPRAANRWLRVPPVPTTTGKPEVVCEARKQLAQTLPQAQPPHSAALGFASTRSCAALVGTRSNLARVQATRRSRAHRVDRGRFGTEASSALPNPLKQFPEPLVSTMCPHLDRRL